MLSANRRLSNLLKLLTMDINFKRITSPYIALFAISLIALISCTEKPSLEGKWQSTKDSGTIEFKSSGEIIIIDNMSATVKGNYKREGNDTLIFELTTSDVMSDSMQPIVKTIVTAKIVKFTKDELHLRFADDDETEDYQRASN